MRGLFAGFVLALALVGCHGEKDDLPAGPQPPTALPKPYVFEFDTVSASVDDQASFIYIDGDMACTDLSAMKVCAAFMETFVSLEVTNGQPQTVTVSWSRARWIDEFGLAHAMARQPGNDSAIDHEVSPGSVYRASHFPAEKSYLVPDEENAYYFTEPIVPWDLRSGDPDEKRWRMVESRTPVFLTVPILTAEGTRSLKFEFQIVPRRKG